MLNVLKAYWPSMRQYRFLLCVVTVTLVTGILLDALYPFLLRAIVNVFISESSDISQAKRFFTWLIVLFVFGNVTWRLFDYALSHF